MKRREFLRFSAAIGASLAGGGILSSCDWEQYLALEGVRILDPHAHPDQFYTENPGVIDNTSTLSGIVEIGMVASSFAAIGDLHYLGTGVPGVGEYEGTKYQLSKVQALADAGKVKPVLSASDVPFFLRSGIPPGAIFSIEGGDPLTTGTVGADPFAVASARLVEFHDLGVRTITLIHYRNNDLGDTQSARPDRDPGPANGGLTPLGKHVVSRMQELGMVVDVAHASLSTLQGVAAISRRPIVDSHTSLKPTDDPTIFRRLRTWEEMETIAATGGIVCTWPYAYEYGGVRRMTFADWAAEIVRMKQRLGMAHVGLGTDGGGNLPSLIEGYTGVQDLGFLAVEMRKVGLSKRDVQAFFGGNLLRVLKECIG